MTHLHQNYQRVLYAFLPLFVLSLLAASCTKKPLSELESPFKKAPVGIMAAKGGGNQTTTLTPVDRNATVETKALFNNLEKISKTGTLFGHQDATKTGYGWANAYDPNDPNAPYIVDADVQKVTGALPAVYGWDFQWIVDFYTGDRKAWETKITRDLTIEAYNRGGINTYSWHYHNPVAKEGIWWRDAQVEAVEHILPGGSHHEVYKNSLRELADYAKSLIGADGKLIPVIFRPFHEMNGDWFWWGKGHTTAADYKKLYQFTVTYLRDELGVHNFLYAWSPDKNFTNLTQYLEWYPGDEYVDVVGTDNYGDLATGTAPAVASGKLKIVSDYAIAKNKVAALTETGLAKLPQADWYTSMLLKALQQQKVELAYVMVWANTKDAYWTPYKGHAAEGDFKTFKASPYVMFGDEAPKMYEIK